MSFKLKNKEHSRAKNLCEMFRCGKGTKGGSKNTYLDPENFTLAWIYDMESLINNAPTKLLKNGKLVVEDGHEFFYANNKLSEQMWSTKSYQVICFYRHLHSEHPQFFRSTLLPEDSCHLEEKF